MMTITIALLTSFIGPIVVLVVKYYLDKQSKQFDNIREALQVSQDVQHKIESIRENVEADRVWLVQFHNGGYFYPTGKSIAKFSLVYETVSVNTKSIQQSFQNIPVSLFSKMLNYLLENETIRVPDCKNEPQGGSLRHIEQDELCTSSYYFAIKSLEDRFIGVLGVNYTNTKRELTNEEIETLTHHAAQIGGVLNANLKKT
jgi:GAF domain-containing protein